MNTKQESRELDRAKRLPAWNCLQVHDGKGWRALNPHEICLLQEAFEFIVEKHLADSEFAELGVTLGVLEES